MHAFISFVERTATSVVGAYGTAGVKTSCDSLVRLYMILCALLFRMFFYCHAITILTLSFCVALVRLCQLIWRSAKMSLK